MFQTLLKPFKFISGYLFGLMWTTVFAVLAFTLLWISPVVYSLRTLTLIWREPISLSDKVLKTLIGFPIASTITLGLGGIIVALASPVLALLLGTVFVLGPLAIAGLSVNNWVNTIGWVFQNSRDLVLRAFYSLFFPERQFGLAGGMFGDANNRGRDGRRRINYGQSAHQETIEEGVKQTLAKFKEKFSDKTDIKSSVEKVKQFRTQVKALKPNNPIFHLKKDTKQEIASKEPLIKLKIKAATNFLNRVINTGSHMTTKREGCRLRDISLWVYNYAQDKNNWLPNVTQADIDLTLIECFYQIQRAYNIDDDGRDDMSRFESMGCFGGTVNRLIYCLTPIVKEIDIKYISSATAVYKLTALTQQSLQQCVKDHADECKLDKDEITVDDLDAKFHPEIKEHIEKPYVEEFKMFSGYQKALTDFYGNTYEYVSANVKTKPQVPVPPENPVLNVMTP